MTGLLALAGSFNSLWNGFAADDAQQIVNNPLIRELENISFAFTNSVWAFSSSDIVFAVDSYYRPLFNVLLSINYSVFGTAAWGWHLSNVLIHVAASLLVFKVLFELTDQRWLSLAAGCLFAVHPAQAESVAWASGITDPLMAMLVLPAFYFYLRYRKTGRRGYVALSVIGYSLGLLCKETALVFPLIVGYCEVFHFTEGVDKKARVKRALLFSALTIVPTVVYFGMRSYAIGAVLFSAGPRYPLGPALLTIPLALLKYLKLMIVPWDYSYQHLTYLVETPTSPRFIFPATVVIALAALMLFSKSKLLKFSAVWFAAWLTPALGALRQFDPEYLVQERYLYLPSIGFCLAIALGIHWLSMRNVVPVAGHTFSVALVGLIVVGWGSARLLQNRVWNDDLTLLRNCTDVEPSSGRAHSAIAQHYFVIGNPREAEANAKKAIELDPQYSGGYTSLSYFNKRYGRLNQAISYLEQATSNIELTPMTRLNLATVHVNLGLLYAERKDAERAEINLRRSVEIWSRALGWNHLGNFYLSQERFEDARAAFEEAARKAPPRYAPIHASLGAVAERLGETDRAREEYLRYLELALPNAPDRSEVQKRLSSLSSRGDR